jgi:hypothetical protein
MGNGRLDPHALVAPSPIPAIGIYLEVVFTTAAIVCPVCKTPKVVSATTIPLVFVVTPFAAVTASVAALPGKEVDGNLKKTSVVVVIYELHF